MANKKGEKVSVWDVAAAAEVSVATVSRVFNGKNVVREETRQRVLDAAEKLGFSLDERRPGRKPQSEKRREVIRFIYFVDVGLEGAEVNHTLMLIKRGVQSAVEQAGYRFVYHMFFVNEEIAFDSDEGVTAGVVLLGECPSRQAERLLRNFPCCWVMTGSWSPTWGDQVMPDHREVGRMAARCLTEQGCVRMKLLRLEGNMRVHRFREEGFAYELSKLEGVSWSQISGDAGDEEHVVIDSENERLERLVARLAACDPLPDGFFVDCDRTLQLLYPRLLRAGIVPGEDMKMVSCNNMEVCRSQLPFDYKSIDVHFEHIGKMAVAQVVWRISNPAPAPRSRILVLPELA